MNVGDEEFGRRDPTIVSGLDRTSNFGRNSRTETPKILHGGSPDISQQAKVIKNVSKNDFGVYTCRINRGHIFQDFKIVIEKTRKNF